MKIFVINLDRNPDRMRFMKKQLNDLGLKFERVSAVDGKKLKKEEIDKLYDDTKANKVLGRSLNLGEIGCAASHLNIYKKIVKENIDYALILEDDTKINPRFIHFLDTYIKIKNKPDHLLLNWKFKTLREIKEVMSNQYILLKLKKKSIISFIWVLFINTLSLMIDSIIFICYKIFGIFLLPYYRNMGGFMAYIITYQGAKKILSLDKKIFVPIDHIPFKYSKYIHLKKRYLVPTFFSRDRPFGSDIQERYRK